jgi:membrane protein implicated in regulation of membrane protease activity
MGSQEWAIIFLVGGLGLAAAEIVAPGLVLLPFGIAGVIAAITGFLGADPIIQGVVFIVASVLLFLALRPVGRRLNRNDTDEGIGSRRLVGASGVVLEDIHADDSGMVRIDRETWRAEAPGDGHLPAGTGITVTEVRGTRVIVTPVSPPTIAPQRPPLGGEPS